MDGLAEELLLLLDESFDDFFAVDAAAEVDVEVVVEAVDLLLLFASIFDFCFAFDFEEEKVELCLLCPLFASTLFATWLETPAGAAFEDDAVDDVLW